MLGLNKPKSEYRVRMYWFRCTGAKGGVLQYDALGLPFGCSYSISQDSSYISSNQGIVYSKLLIETDANYKFKKNDAIEYLGHKYIIKNIDVDNNSISGSDYTNKPSSIVKYIEIEG